MPTYPLKGSDGQDYDVEAPDVNQAVKALQGHIQENLRQSYEKSGNEAPEWAKPFIAARDVGVSAADLFTGGYGAKGVEKLTGFDAPAHAKAIKDNMGWAGTALDAGLMARYLPTLIPKAVKYMGGGPTARGIVGTTTAAGEGGAVGGVQAAGHDEDVATGTGLGVLGGVGGYGLGNIINKGVNWFKGVDNTVPSGGRMGIKIFPSNVKNPSAADKINVTANAAASKASVLDDPLAAQTKYKTGFEKLSREEPAKTFTKEQLGLMQKITQDDPATQFSRFMGNTLTNKMALGAGVGGGIAAGNPAAAILGPIAMMGAGRTLKGVSAGGTQEAVDNLRRALLGRKKIEGPLDISNVAKLSKAFRQLADDEGQ